MTSPRIPLPRLAVTAVATSPSANGAQGGLWLVDFGVREVLQTLKWTGLAESAEPALAGAGDDRGLRGIAFSPDAMYVASSRALYAYGPDFQQRRSFQCSYLRQCEDISRLDHHLFLVSSAIDSILAFDLEKEAFMWALHVTAEGGEWRGTRFDPLGAAGPGAASGPPARNRLGLNSIHADSRGLFVGGLHTGGLLHVGNESVVNRVVEMPEGVHNAQPFRDGVLFNDTAAGVLRFVGRDGTERAFRVPRRDGRGELVSDPGQAGLGGFARGLCAVDEFRVAGGSSPGIVTLYDLESGRVIGSVDFSADADYTIHSVAAWPFA